METNNNAEILAVLKEQNAILERILSREDEAFTDMYRELREIKVRLTEVNK